MWHDWSSRRRVLALSAAALSSLATALASGRARAAEPKPVRWMFHRGPGVAAGAADAGASRALANTAPYILRKPGDNLVVPPAWKAILVAPCQSFASIQEGLEQHTFAPGVRGILYDYEKWQFTPEDEQRNPAGYVKRAAALVHAAGLLFLTSPSANLVKVMAPDTGRPDADMFDAYLQLGIAADAARYADVYVIQTQRALRDTELSASFVQQAAAQARAANPRVEVIAGVSTNPIGRRVVSDDIVRLIGETRNVVDGYWMNIPTRNDYSPGITEYRPDIAIDVIRRVAGR